jgi:cytochrome c peroxidase
MSRKTSRIAASLGTLGITALAAAFLLARPPAWTANELEEIRGMALASLPAAPEDPSNRFAADPAAAALGKALFFDGRLSANGEVSCGSCHQPERQFQDDVALARGVGQTARRTMPLAGAAHLPFLFWDGRKDSLWSQALGPLESAVEHGGDRTQYARVVAAHYRDAYEAVFGALPPLGHLPAHAGPVEREETRAAWEDMSAADREAVTAVFANIGKAIAAYERTIVPEETRFDRFASAILEGKRPRGENALSSQETAGLRLFIGKAGCSNCHNGPLLSDGYFHNTGVPAVRDLPEDLGRSRGVADLMRDPFNCAGAYSDADPESCDELRYMVTEGEELVRAYRTPSLRGAATRPPYMHAGQLPTLAAVVAHYRNAPAAPAGHNEVHPLALDEKEQAEIVAFLKTLSGD